MATARSLSIGIVLLAVAASVSCFDPVHADAVAALGGEVSGVRPGPRHRPGQPCLTCHGGDGPASPEFSFAGTVFLERDSVIPAEGTTVAIRQGSDETIAHEVKTNEVGNFYVKKAKFDPAFPVFVALADPRIVPNGLEEMITPLGRRGDCGFCHAKDIAQADTRRLMPHVYLNDKRTGTQP